MDKHAKKDCADTTNNVTQKKMWVKAVSGDSTKAVYFMHREFSIGYEGENDLTLHASTEMHKATLAKGASNIGAFFMTSTEETDIVGKHLSVYQLLSSANNRILKANCPAHIAHNACKHACDQLSVDIETIVLQIYSHLSVSASRH